MRRSKFILIVMIIIVMIGGCGCMDNKGEREIEEITEFLNAKYDDNFYFSDVLAGDFSDEYPEYYFTSDLYPDRGIWVTKGDTGDIYDNYLAIKYDDQVQELKEKCMKEAFPNQRMFIREGDNISRTEIEGGNKNTTFEDYVSRKEAILFLCAYVDVSDYDFDKKEVEEQLESTFSRNGICLECFEIYFYDNAEQFDLILCSSNELDKSIFREDYMNMLVGRMESDLSLPYVKWEK